MTEAQQAENKGQQTRTLAELVEEIQVLTTEIQELYCLDEIPWIIGVSWGKDSSTVLQLVWNAIAALPPDKRTKTIHVITTDTKVENPIVSAWVRQSMKQLESAAQEKGMPISPHLLQPVIEDTFWVNLIGKGYPAPRNQFRWCTPRLKINPANQFIRQIVRTNGETILVLGTRKAESTKRAATMKKHQAGRVRDRLSPNASLPNSLIYTPIEDWSNNEVWIYLNQCENPWGKSNKELFNLYRGATADNECPLVIDTSTPSCGDSRFGCWVCTLVSQDKSMQAMIQNDEEKQWMQPLLDLRNKLDAKDDRDKRDFRRIWGDVQLFERNKNGKTSVEPIPGPYTKYWRESWLKELLEAQTKIRRTAPEDMRDITLISLEELSEIRRIWLEEKHEFDDSLPRIYQEVTGEEFKDPRPGADLSLLGSDEWSVLEEICAGDGMHLELVAKLLDTERQYRKMSRRIGIYETLEQCFTTSSRSKKEAVDNAHLKRDLKKAVEQGDIQKVKQLTLADFAVPNEQAMTDCRSETIASAPITNAPDTQGDAKNTTKPVAKAKAWGNKKFKNKETKS
ncbi:Phosphoadenosine phosphosulfate reductase [Trichormus variabilis ATCC 29413]|uniref:Phosphoadenosine phosphosulfate reductase n=2 Tax=Anabaena variabilis TaxID=264691 RepID=Q3MB09_TRIV2|nr:MULTISPECIES: DNA phosphorothioation system sulfurtransferase DndC [Nostocaceae]ABA21827.1 Phosphoadenosine phosphosulfate reductase [Trichormus variabilis ATCC 29413]MBC1214823.1 DNA phosphorothioation system sulfurtransferase DndC [Trichormus variabilis ARAD]MBC1257011.1 DNA phosphorothioation system sulfurtransferase DndC [Trichormus variabilis V5]MBC1266899.1 DNA phosphorothioation system sulfurtransferase DndC [Trichormus variabilis FSR]MBC1303656.1 DNA phosphorothioation system sulfur